MTRRRDPQEAESPHPPTTLEEIGAYIRFSSADLERLRAVAPILDAHLPAMAKLFYEAIQVNPRAAQVLREGPEQVPRLQQSLIGWARSLLTDDRDERYGESRRRVGMRHVELQLENRYVLGALTQVRTFLSSKVQAAMAHSPVLEPTLQALHRAIDLDGCLLTEAYFVQRRTVEHAGRELAQNVARHVQALLLRGAHNLTEPDAIRAQICRLVTTDWLAIALERPEDGTVELAGISSNVEVRSLRPGTRVVFRGTLLAEMLRHGASRTLPLDAPALPTGGNAFLRAIHKAGMRMITGFPMWSESRVIGALVLATSRPDPDFERWQSALTAIADAIAMAAARWETTRRLAASEQLHRSLFEAVNDGICVLDLDGRYSLCNTTFEAQMGRSREDIVGHRVDEIYPKGLRETIKALHESVISTGKPAVAQLLFEVAGKDRWMSFSHSPIRDAQGQVAGLTCVTRDVTDDRVRVAQQAHHHKMASLGLLASGVAHEVNNPLASIAMMAQDLLDSAPAARSDDILHRILSTTQSAGRSLQQLLRFARPGQGQPDMVLANEVIEQARDVVSFDPRARGIKLVCHLDPALPWVMGNADQLTQVVLNLLLNAMDAMAGRRGNVEVRTGVDGPWVTVAVSDHGPGVPTALRSRVFEPFYSTKNDAGGTGLGLFVCRKLIGEHGGTVSIEDTPGSGATFIVRLPIPGKTPQASK